MLTNISIIKQDERGTIYDCEKLNVVIRKKGSISANHSHEEKEIMYLIQGKIELTLGNETKIIEAPTKITTESNEYNKILALTDMILLYER